MIWPAKQVCQHAYVDDEFDPLPSKFRRNSPSKKAVGHRRIDIRKKAWGRDSVRDEGVQGMFTACNEGYVDILRPILDAATDLQGLLVQKGPSGLTALHLAVNSNSLGVTEALMEASLVCTPACPNELATTIDKGGMTPLHLASRENFVGQLRLIIPACSNPERLLLIENSEQETPLHVACRENHPECIHAMMELMVSRGVEDESVTAVLVASDLQDRSVFHVAAQRGFFKVVEALLMWCDPEGPDFKTILGMKDNKRMTALDWSKMNAEAELNKMTVNLLEEALAFKSLAEHPRSKIGIALPKYHSRASSVWRDPAPEVTVPRKSRNPLGQKSPK